MQPHLVTAGFQHLSPLALHLAVQRRVLPDFIYGRGMALRPQILRSELSSACDPADGEPAAKAPLEFATVSIDYNRR